MTCVAPHEDQQHDWAHPPVGGYTADDLDRLPGLPPHTELIDGSLIVISPQTNFHLWVVRLLEHCLLMAVPENLEVLREMNVTLAKRQRPIPDVMVVRAEAVTGNKQATYQAKDVVLVVEVESEESEDRDRETKPLKYAKAGIRHFWRVEEGENGLPVVYVYELDESTSTYGVSGVHRDRLKVSAPFPTDIPLTPLRRLPRSW